MPKESSLIIYNPRRENFPIHDPNASLEQIKWEFDHLKSSDIISFWFSRGSLNPIVLFEFGKWFRSEKTILLGIDPEYERRKDVEIQTMYENNDIYENIKYNLNELALAIKIAYFNIQDLKMFQKRNDIQS